jgi:hypothetical protein
MENFRAIELHQVRDFSRKMSATFEFVRQNFLPLMKSLFFIAGPPILLATFFLGDFYAGLASTGMRGSMAIMDWMQSPGFFLEIAGIMVFSILAGVFTVSVINNYVKLYDEKKTNKIDVNDVWIRVRQTLLKYFATTFLYVFFLVLAYFVAIIVPIWLFRGSEVVMVFGLMITCTGFFYLFVAMGLIFPVRAFENVGFFTAMSRSFFLIYGKWWSTFGLLFVTWLVAYILSVAFLIPVAVIREVGDLHSTDLSSFDAAPSAQSTMIIRIFYSLYFLVGFIFQTLPMIAITFQYFNLVERKEAKGLMERIESFGEEPAAAPEQHDEHY